MTFWGVTFSGKRLLLGEPLEASLCYDRDAPADLLRARFPADKLWDELKEAELWEGGRLVFRGLVDEQDTELSSSGLTVELVCRSLEALLLDNEALPETITSPSLPLLEKKLLSPLGLILGEGDRERKRGRLTVKKGKSCWGVLADFCAGFLGTVPSVDPEGKVRCDGGKGGSLELGEVLSAKIKGLPCKEIGQVWLQSCRGTYDTLYRGKRPEILRRRYVSMESGKDPKKLLAQGEQDSFLLTVTCAGALWPPRGALASVTVPGAGRFENCPVRSALYLRDRSGERTRFTLERPLSGQN